MPSLYIRLNPASYSDSEIRSTCIAIAGTREKRTFLGVPDDHATKPGRGMSEGLLINKDNRLISEAAFTELRPEVVAELAYLIDKSAIIVQSSDGTTLTSAQLLAMVETGYYNTVRGVITVTAGAAWTAVTSILTKNPQTEVLLAAGGILLGFEAVNASAAGNYAYYKLNATNLVDAGGVASPIASSVSVFDLDGGAPINAFAVVPAADGDLTVTAIWGY